MYDFLRSQSRALWAVQLHVSGLMHESMVIISNQCLDLVFICFMCRLKPSLYWKISIFSEGKAWCLVNLLTLWLKSVQYLYISMSVCPEISSMLLHLCPHLKNLNLQAGGNNICHINMVLDTLNDLIHLKYLAVNPTLLFCTWLVHLPDMDIFHHMTHLDLTSCWTWEAITSSFQYHSQSTHLSLNWNITCASTDGLHKLLACEHFGVIML